MNKKFSTLLAGLFFAGLFSVAANAQHAGEIPYRTQITKADAFDATQNDLGVNAINENHWYQLEVTTPTTEATPVATKYVLAQVRDYATGNLTLKAVPQALLTTEALPAANPSLTSSLWKIDVSETSTPGSFLYEFVNKETGYKLSYSCADAIHLTAKGDLTTAATSTDLQAITTVNTINKSDVSVWRWYTTPTNATAFSGSKLYTFNHDSKKVLGLALGQVDGATNIADVVLVDIPREVVMDGSGQEMVPGYNILLFTVRNAGARVLNAADINNMIDADGSWSNKTSTPTAGFKVNGFTGTNDLFSGKYTAINTQNADYLNTATGTYAGYSIILNKVGTTPAEYFMVATDSTYESTELPTAHGGLVLLDATAPANLLTTMNALNARYHWKVTYFPTPDSLAFEPLNASIVGAEDKKAGTKWATTPLFTAPVDSFYNTVNEGWAHAAGLATGATNVPFNKPALVPVALIQMNATDGIDAARVLTVGQSKNTAVGVHKTGKYGKPVLTAAPADMGLKVQFDNKYPYLQRASLTSDVYFIKISVNENQRKDYRKEGMYLVYNMEGRLMYDSQDDNQNYYRMPATQWVIERDTCDLLGGTPWVTIKNREYGNDAPSLFYGQLYQVPETDKYYIINHADYNVKSGTDGKFPNANPVLSCGDTIYFTPVGDVKADAYLGYKHFDVSKLKFETYAMKYLHAPVLGAPNTDSYLNIKEEGGFDFLSINAEEGALDFEIDTLLVNNTFGYTSTKAGAVQLFRTNYALKVRDANLLDNEWKYVVVTEDANRNPYYQMKHLQDVDGENVKLATFYFKTDQVTDATETAAAADAYALIDATGWGAEAHFMKENWIGAKRDSMLNLNNLDETAPYSPRKFMANGFKRVDVKDVNAKLSYMTLNTAPMDRVSAFIFTETARPLYETIPSNANYKVSRARGGAGQAVEYLYEDAHNSAGLKDGEYINGFRYAGMTANDGTVGPIGAAKGETTAFYVDAVLASNDRMPKYLFFVDKDSVANGRWCVTDQHGYFATEEAANELDATHHVYYNGYVAGRILVNLNDSIKEYTDHGMLNQARKYGYRNYTRLGFVEAIHMNVTAEEFAQKDMQFNPSVGEHLFILTGTTLEELTRFEVIDPKLLNAAIAAGKVQDHTLTSLQQNYAWSLRMAADASDMKEVLLESAGLNVNGGIGTFTEAGWVQVLNSVPVMAQKYNINGDHTEINGSSTLSQLVNQAQLFSFEATEDPATSNEDITAGTVKVYGGNGTITVQGAEGNVAITNTLGQTIVNKSATGSEFTVEVPAGIMIVKVAGQPAVKVLVK
jgi:hypothetical protein